MSRIISPNGKISVCEYLRSIWKYRHLTIALAKGEIKNLSALNVSGIFLNIIQTIIGLFVYWIVFGIAIGIDTGDIPYPLFVLPGIFVWHFFSDITGYCSNCLVANQNLIAKLYFPRINIVFSKVIVALVDLTIGFAIFVLAFICFQQNFSISWTLYPLILIVLIFTITTIGLWISFLSLFSMDMARIAVQLTNFLIFITPVFYPETIIPDGFKWIMFINPIAGIIEYSRWSLLGTAMPDIRYLTGLGLILILGLVIFFIYKKYEKRISDML